VSEAKELVDQMSTSSMRKPVRIGICGPVGSGKSHLLVQLVRRLGETHSVAVITNDIYTKEDAEFVTRSGVIDADRIVAVETGGCPHTAIRDDVSMNLVAVNDLTRRFPDLDIILIESGGDNLTVTFSPELADSFIFVIDVGEGEKIPRKGGPGIARSPLLLINKIDIAQYVDADVGVMQRDAEKLRGDLPIVLGDMKRGVGVDEILRWIRTDVMMEETA